MPSVSTSERFTRSSTVELSHGDRRISALEFVRKSILDLTREQLAVKAGITARALQDIELRGARPRRATAAALGRVMDLDPQWILDVVAEHRSALDAAQVADAASPRRDTPTPATESVAREPVAQEHEADVRSS